MPNDLTYEPDNKNADFLFPHGKPAKEYIDRAMERYDHDIRVIREHPKPMTHSDQRLMLAKEAMAVYLQDGLNHLGEKINERRIAFKAVQMADRVLAQLAIPAGPKDA